MKSLSTEKTMTVKEVADVFGVVPETIKKHVRVLFPQSIRNGIPIMLTEQQVTDIKQRMIPTTQVVGSKTDIEMIQSARDVMAWMDSKIKIQEKQIKVLKVKADVADLIADTTGKTGLSVAGKQITGHPNLFCKWLEDSKILYRLQGVLVPRADLQDRGYFVVKTTVDSLTNKSYYQTFLTPKGMAWVTALWLKKNAVVVNDQASELRKIMEGVRV